MINSLKNRWKTRFNGRLADSIGVRTWQRVGRLNHRQIVSILLFALMLPVATLGWSLHFVLPGHNHASCTHLHLGELHLGESVHLGESAAAGNARSDHDWRGDHSHAHVQQTPVVDSNQVASNRADTCDVDCQSSQSRQALATGAVCRQEFSSRNALLAAGSIEAGGDCAICQLLTQVNGVALVDSTFVQSLSVQRFVRTQQLLSLETVVTCHFLRGPPIA